MVRIYNLKGCKPCSTFIGALAANRLNTSKQRTKGFTLIELIVVIVILAIISIVAIPRFINIAGNARTSSIEGVGGAARSAAQLTKAQALVEGKDGTAGNDTLVIDGQNIKVNTALYPVTSGAAGVEGIGSAANISSPAPTCTATTCTWTLRTDCIAIYTASTGSVAITSTGCA